MEELLELARDLVAIPSHDDPGPVGDRIEEWLRAETDATVRRDEVGNVLARRGVSGDRAAGDRAAAERAAGADERPTLALVGHHDVVPPDDEQVVDAGDEGDVGDVGDDGNGSDGSDGVEYVVERRDGRLYGRGSADMKGAVAAQLLAFRDADLGAADGASGPSPELAFASFVGEETGGRGARHAIERGFAPDWAVVGEGSTGYSEPGVTDVAVAHKGRRASTVVADGRSAHASVPEEGTNAIYRGCEAVDRLRSIEPPSVRVGDDVLEGSLVVTEIDGGSAWNVVPDRCTVTVDERTVPGERAPIEDVAALEGISVEIDQDLPPMRCDDDAFAALVLDAARSVQRDVGGGGGSADDRAATPQHVAKPHATDAGWLSDAGVECVVCGPAEPGEAHTAEESVSLAVLDRCYRIYRTVASSGSRLEGDGAEAP